MVRGAAARPVDEAELQVCLAGRAEALREYVAHRIPAPLRRTLCPEDVLQEVWIAAFRDHARVRLVGPDALERWVATIANRKLIDAIRHARRIKRGRDWRCIAESDKRTASFVALVDLVAPGNRTPSRDSSAKEAAQAVRVALAGLPEDWRRAVWMRHIEGRTPAEMAAAMHRTLPAVNSLVFRGLQELRTRLGHAGKFFSDARSDDGTLG